MNDNTQMVRHTPEQILKGELSRPKFLARLAEVLPPGYDPARFAMAAATAAANNPKLYECPPVAIMGQLIRAAYLGLQVDGVLGQAYIIPYGKVPTLVPGYKGLIKLAHEAGAIRSIVTGVVYENDEFEVLQGSEQRIHHRPTVRGPRGEFIGAYAIATLPDGDEPKKCTQIVEWMTDEQIKEIRDRSQSYKNWQQYGKQSPWVTDYAMMARKCPVSRVIRYLPHYTNKLSAAIAIDTATDAGQEPDYTAMDADIGGDAIQPEQPIQRPQVVSANTRLEERAKARQKPQDSPSAPPDGPPTPEEQAEILAQEEAAYKAQQGGLPGMRS